VGFTSGIQDRDDPTLFCSRGGQHVSDRTGAAVQSVAAAETRHPSGYAVAMYDPRPGTMAPTRLQEVTFGSIGAD
jgi:hypothetical protein